MCDMKSLFSLSVLLLVLCPVTSIASSWGGGRGFESGLFFGADLNRDERLDQQEAKAVKNLAEDKIFARYDEDNSGYITRLEFKEYIQQSPWMDKFVAPNDR